MWLCLLYMNVCVFLTLYSYTQVQILLGHLDVFEKDQLFAPKNFSLCKLLIFNVKFSHWIQAVIKISLQP